MAPTFLGGKLKLKGKKKKKSKHSLAKKSDIPDKPIQNVDNSDAEDEDLTETERKSLARKKERERIEIEETAGKSHRERVEEFNEKIGNLTELNDIPRVSAAGNG